MFGLPLLFREPLHKCKVLLLQSALETEVVNQLIGNRAVRRYFSGGIMKVPYKEFVDNNGVYSLNSNCLDRILKMESAIIEFFGLHHIKLTN